MEQIYITVKKFCELHPVYTESSVRNAIAKRYLNGLHDTGALMRINEKSIRVNELALLSWFVNRGESIEQEMKKKALGEL